MSDLDKKVKHQLFGDVAVSISASFLASLAQGIASGYNIDLGGQVNTAMVFLPYVLNIGLVYETLTFVEQDNLSDNDREFPSRLEKLVCSIGAGTIFYSTSAGLGFSIGYIGSSLLSGL